MSLEAMTEEQKEGAATYMAEMLASVLGPKNGRQGYTDIQYDPKAEGGTKVGLRATFADVYPRIIFVNKTPESHNGLTHVGRGYDTRNEQRVLLDVLKKARDIRGIAKLQEWVELPPGFGIATIYDYIEGDNLEQLVQKNIAAGKTINVKDTLSIFEQVVKTSARLLKDHDVLHRDLKPSNIMVGYEKDKLVATIVDFANAGLVKDMQIKYRPTAGGHFVRHPDLFNDEAKYDEKKEIYSLGSSLYFALTGKYLFDIDHNEQTGVFHARANLEQRVQVDISEHGRVDKKKHEAELKAAIKRLPSSVRRKAGEILYKALTTTDESYGTLESMLWDLQEATIPLHKTHVFKMTTGALITAGLFAVVAGSNLWYEASKKAAKLEDDARYVPVEGKWFGSSNTVRNGVYDITLDAHVTSGSPNYQRRDPIRSDVYGSENKYYLQANPGEKISARVTLEEVVDLKIDVDETRLPVRIYVERFKARESENGFGDDKRLTSIQWLRPREADPAQFSKRMQASRGRSYGDYVDQVLDVPQEPGVYTLVAEAYAPEQTTRKPKEDNPYTMHRETKGVKFSQPGQIISRVTMPLVVGDIADKVVLSQFYGKDGWSVDGYGVGDEPKIILRFDDLDHNTTKLNRELQYKITFPEENIQYTLNDKNGYMNSATIEIPVDGLPEDKIRMMDVQVINNGALLYRTALPIRTHQTIRMPKKDHERRSTRQYVVTDVVGSGHYLALQQPVDTIVFGPQEYEERRSPSFRGTTQVTKVPLPRTSAYTAPYPTFGDTSIPEKK